MNDKHYHWLEENKDFDWKSYENTKNNIRKELKNSKKIQKIAQDSLDLIKNNEEIEDFAGGKKWNWRFFKNNLNLSKKELSPMNLKKRKLLKIFKRSFWKR